MSSSKRYGNRSDDNNSDTRTRIRTLLCLHPCATKSFVSNDLLFLVFLPDGPSSRRAFFEKGATALATGAAIAASPAAANAYSVPDLPYPFEALEPYIDTPTMK
eukprot:scaffold31792_cov168-Amphora_coffeaeformis.AAC.9